MVPPAAIWRLMHAYPKARKRQLTLHPTAYGGNPIGQLGAFASRNSVVWPDIIAD